MILPLRVARAYLKNAHDFSCVQVELPENIAEEIREWEHKNISEDILTGNGFEEDKHVTIKYGIHIVDFTEVRDLFKNEKPIKMKLGKITLFTSNNAFDVIKIDVISPDLHRLNKSLSKNFEVTDTHPVYYPHCTIAYVKKGAGESFDGNNTFEGEEIISDTILFSGRDNRSTIFKLFHER